MSASSNSNSNGNSLFFTGNSSRAKKLEEPAWSLLYDESEMPKLMGFVMKNLNDLPKYRHHTRDMIIRACFIGYGTRDMELNYDVIVSRYTKLRAFYSVKAANKIIEYVNANYQHGSKNIIRPTLNLIISLFEPNIIEEFERDFTIDKLRKILEIYLFSPKYRTTAYHICKDPSINLETNSRIQYKPSWVQSGVNALSSKKFLFEHFFTIFSGKQDPFSADVMKKAFNLDVPMFSSTDYGPLSAKGRQLFRNLGGIYKKEIEGYEQNLSKDWSHCLPNEVQTGSNCIPIPYLRLDITDKEKEDMLADLFEIIKKVTSLSDDDEKSDQNSETPVDIINEYELHKYIGGQYGIKPATYDELVEYAIKQDISVDEHSTADNISFVILFTMCKDIIVETINDVINAFIKLLSSMEVISSEQKKYIDYVRGALDKISKDPSQLGIKPVKLSVSTYISYIKAIKKILPDFVKEDFETILSVLVQSFRAYNSYHAETHNQLETLVNKVGNLTVIDALYKGYELQDKLKKNIPKNKNP